MSEHVLYRLVDANNTVLYIGITKNVASRMKRHRLCQPWWPQVTDIPVQVFPDRGSVLAAERKAIEAESPRHNIQHHAEATAAARLRRIKMSGRPWEAAA